MSTSLNTSTRTAFVSLTSNQAPNLKTLLKHLIRKGASSSAVVDEDDDEELTTAGRKGPRLLNYDLQILQNTVTDRKLDQVVVAFQDSEAFDGSLLSDTIELLR